MLLSFIIFAYTSLQWLRSLKYCSSIQMSSSSAASVLAILSIPSMPAAFAESTSSWVSTSKLIVFNSYSIILKPWNELLQVLCDRVMVLFWCPVKEGCQVTSSLQARGGIWFIHNHPLLNDCL